MAFNDPTVFDFSSFGRSATNSSSAGPTPLSGSVVDLLNPSKFRLGSLLANGASAAAKQPPVIGFASRTSSSGGATTLSESDWRIRVSLADNADYFYKNSTQKGIAPSNIQSPLVETNGLIFPYTPTIGITQSANYTPVSPAHSNYPLMFYNNSDVADISISGEFTVQSISEGQYLMAAIYFLRGCTKMFFGQGANAGNPPPTVFLDGYGSHYFPHVPCVITSFTHTLPNEVDYIEIPITSSILEETTSAGVPGFVEDFENFADSQGRQGAGQLASQGRTTNFGVERGTKQNSIKEITTFTRLPTTSTISINLKPVYSRSNLHDRFDLEKFANGELLADSNLGYGGFI